MALLGFLGNSQSAGARKCDRWWRSPPEDRLGAEDKSALGDDRFKGGLKNIHVDQRKWPTS
jgi:hypothetical protein